MSRKWLDRLRARKPLDVLLAQAAEEGSHSLRRCLGPFQLVTLGVGCIIGAGIFVLALGVSESAWSTPRWWS